MNFLPVRSSSSPSHGTCKKKGVNSIVIISMPSILFSILRFFTGFFPPFTSCHSRVYLVRREANCRLLSLTLSCSSGMMNLTRDTTLSMSGAPPGMMDAADSDGEQQEVIEVQILPQVRTVVVVGTTLRHHVVTL